MTKRQHDQLKRICNELRGEMPGGLDDEEIQGLKKTVAKLARFLEKNEPTRAPRKRAVRGHELPLVATKLYRSNTL